MENLVKRKLTGGRRIQSASRRAHQKDGYPAETVVGNDLRTSKIIRGGSFKVRARIASTTNVVDPVSNKVTKSKILKVVDNPADRDYARRGVMTKGAIISTDLGQAKVVSRPGQDGVVNSVLVK